LYAGKLQLEGMGLHVKAHAGSSGEFIRACPGPKAVCGVPDVNVVQSEAVCLKVLDIR